jgi:hypothetical protein
MSFIQYFAIRRIRFPSLFFSQELHQDWKYFYLAFDSYKTFFSGFNPVVNSRVSFKKEHIFRIENQDIKIYSF